MLKFLKSFSQTSILQNEVNQVVPMDIFKFETSILSSSEIIAIVTKLT